MQSSQGPSQAQVVCVPPSVATHGPLLGFLLNPAPSSRKPSNNRFLNHSVCPPTSPPTASYSPRLRRRRSSASRHSLRSPRTPLSSFLNLVDTPSTCHKASPRSSTAASFYLATPSPVLNTKRHGRTYDHLPFTFVPSPTTPAADQENQTILRSSEETLVSNGEDSVDDSDDLQKQKQLLAFLHSDPYSVALLSPPPPKFTFAYGPRPAPIPLAELPAHSFLDHSPPSSPVRPFSRKRSATTTAPKSSKPPPSPSHSVSGKVKSLKLKSSTFFKSMASSSSHSSSSSNSTATARSKPRKAPEKILPFTTQQIAELDRLMGNPKAAKGKIPSSFVSHSHAPAEEKRYIAPYVPLNGSAPSGTRSFGRDGEMHSIGASQGTGAREVGHGNSLPYFRDENGVLWNGQEEMDEFQQLIPEAKQKAQMQRIDTRRGSDDEWKHFSPASASSLDSGRSPLRSAGSSEVFDLGYDEAVMIPEGGAVTGVSTFGGLAKTNGVVTVAQSTRGVESFPHPSVPYHGRSDQSSPRPKGSDRRRPMTAPREEPAPNGDSVTSLGTIRPPLPLDKEGRNEYFADAFSPPATFHRQRTEPLYYQQQPMPQATEAPVSKSRLHRHSTSLAIGSAKLLANMLGNAPPQSPMSPTSPSYLAPLNSPTPYNGIRQASFSGPCHSPTTRSGGPLPPRPYTAEKQLKKKGSGLGVAQMFKKISGKA